jgi:NAD(P)-dependent dehydrogenase (short-subunit alcohol dehydrogenase family)
MSGRTGTGAKVIVSGAGRGLGREIALRLAARGCSLGLIDIEGGALTETARLCRQNGAALCEEVVTDLAEPGATGVAVEGLAEKLGGLDVLVNNAAYSKIELFWESREEVWQRTFAVNVIAVAMACRAAATLMKAEGKGRIVNMTSPSARMAIPEYVAYSASKAAIDSLTRSIAASLGPFGITVNSFNPGMMDTVIQQSTEVELARLNGRADLEAFRTERTRRIPLGRRPELGETAEAAVWLCLDAPAYMTAERMNMSGGLDKD